MQKRPDEDTAANTQLISCFQRGGQIHQPLYQYPEGRHGGNYAPDQLFPAWWADPSAPVSVSRRKTWRQLLTWSAVSSVVGRSISRCISIPEEEMATTTHLISCFRRGGQIHQPLYQYPRGTHGGNYAPDQQFPAWWADPSAAVSVSRPLVPCGWYGWSWRAQISFWTADQGSYTQGQLAWTSWTISTNSNSHRKN